MIKIFNKDTRVFNSNGNLVIHPLELFEVKESSLNGWSITVKLPVLYNGDIHEGMIAYVETKSKGGQPFIIQSPKRTNTHIEFTANHVVFDSINYILEDVRPTNMSAIGALNYINERTDIVSPFTMSSNVANSQTAYFIDKTLLHALDTIQERWGGVYDVDKFSIALRNKVGLDRGYSIMYGKNLEGVQVFEDWSAVVTKLRPVGFDGITLPEGFLYSEIDYGKPYTKVIKFETELEDDEKTIPNLIEELRINAQTYLEINQFPMISYEVESNVSQELDIGDTVQVKHPVVTIEANVIAYEYDLLTKRTTKVVFGNYKRDVKKKINVIKDAINEVKEKTSSMESILVDQTELINSMNKFGHVYIDDYQIMILDKLPKETAKNVWRWTLGGLAFSENGIEGPFKQAWTMDGKFNTDFIAAGSIMTNQLSSDVGSGLDISSNESITNLVRDIESFNNSNNMIPGLTGVQGYVNWVGNSDLMPTDDLIPYEGLTGAMNFVFKKFKDSLSPFGKSFTSSGNPISPKGFIVPDVKYSYRIKVHTFKPFSIDVLEYSSYEGQVLKSTNFKFESYDKYLEFEVQPAKTTSYIALRFNVVASYDNRLEFSEDMFNRGVARNFELSPIDVQLYSESSRVQLSNEIKDTVEAIELVNGKTIKNYTVIQQLSEKIVLAVDASGNLVTVELGSDPSTGSYFVVKAQQIKLEGYTTINDGFQVLANGDVKMTNADVSGKITATSGSIGDFDINGGILETTRTFTTKKFAQSDSDRIRNIMMATVEPTQSDWDNLDIDGNGVIELRDLAEVTRCVNGIQPNPMIIKEVITMGKNGSIRTERVVANHSNRVLSTSVIENGGVRTGSATVGRLYLIGARGGNGSLDTGFEVFIDYQKEDQGRYPLYAMPRSKVKPT